MVWRGQAHSASPFQHTFTPYSYRTGLHLVLYAELLPPLTTLAPARACLAALMHMCMQAKIAFPSPVRNAVLHDLARRAYSICVPQTAPGSAPVYLGRTTTPPAPQRPVTLSSSNEGGDTAGMSSGALDEDVATPCFCMFRGQQCDGLN